MYLGFSATIALMLSSRQPRQSDLVNGSVRPSLGCRAATGHAALVNWLSRQLFSLASDLNHRQPLLCVAVAEQHRLARRLAGPSTQVSVCSRSPRGTRHSSRSGRSSNALNGLGVTGPDFAPVSAPKTDSKLTDGLDEARPAGQVDRKDAEGHRHRGGRNGAGDTDRQRGLQVALQFPRRHDRAFQQRGGSPRQHQRPHGHAHQRRPAVDVGVALEQHQSGPVPQIPAVGDLAQPPQRAHREKPSDGGPAAGGHLSGHNDGGGTERRHQRGHSPDRAWCGRRSPSPPAPPPGPPNRAPTSPFAHRNFVIRPVSSGPTTATSPPTPNCHARVWVAI